MADISVSGSGYKLVRAAGVLATGAALLLGAVAALVALIQLWPPAATSASPSVATAPTAPTKAASARTSSPPSTLTVPAGSTTINDAEAYPYVVLGVHVSLPAENDLFALVALAGAIGGFIHSMRSVSWYVGNRTLRRSWLLLYALLPAVGALMATVFYLVLRGGLVAGQDAATDINPYGVTAIAALVGLFSSQASEKLKAVFETLLSKPPPGSDNTPPARPTVTGLNPTHGRVGSKLTLSGSGLSGASAAHFGHLSAPGLQVASDSELVVSVPPGAETGPVTITTPDGSIESASFTVDP
jgi:hypothetical protein